MTRLQLLLIVAGVMHLGILSAGALMPRVLGWKRALAALGPLTRHVIWTHAAFVFLTISAFGLASLLLAGPLADGSPLARAVCGFVAVFWGIRLFIQFFLFDARPFLTNRLLAAGYHGLTVAFAYFTLVYGLAAVAPALVG